MRNSKNNFLKILEKIIGNQSYRNSLGAALNYVSIYSMKHLYVWDIKPIMAPKNECLALSLADFLLLTLNESISFD